MATSAIYAIQAQSSLSPGLLFVSFPDLTPAAIGLGNKAVPTALFFDVLADTVADLQAKQGKPSKASLCIYIYLFFIKKKTNLGRPNQH